MVSNGKTRKKGTVHLMQETNHNRLSFILGPNKHTKPTDRQQIPPHSIHLIGPTIAPSKIP